MGFCVFSLELEVEIVGYWESLAFWSCFQLQSQSSRRPQSATIRVKRLLSFS